MTPQAQAIPEYGADQNVPRLRGVRRRPDADRLRILLVEDNPTDAELLAEALSSRTDDAFEITHVERLEDATRAACEHSFEIMLLDLGLAETRGLETLVAARARIPHVPIIVLTGMDDDDLGLHALQAGAEDYLVKGQVDTRLLVRAIRYAKERHAHIEDIRRLNDELKGSLDRKLGELRHAQDKSVRNERMAAIGTIAAGVAHELNSPLMGVLNHVQYAAAKLPKDYARVHDALSGALEYSRRCASIIQALLMHARQDFPTGAALRITYGRVGDAVSVALRDARNLLEACRVRVEIDTDEPLPEVALDQSTLQLVLLNLIRNACHAMRHSAAPTIWIGARQVEQSIELRVRDNGEGIDPETLEQIFEPLYSTKPSGMGSGLGLALCKCLVENAGGRITASSEEGEGTIFAILLPTPDVANGYRLTAFHGRAASSELKRVLIIDDDDAVRSAFRLALDDVNADIVTVDSGERALTLAGDGALDLVFLDLKMPVMDGVDTLRKLRAAGCRAPIFIVTGFAEEFMARLRTAADQGMDFEVMRKPLERNDIRSVVSAVLGGS